MRTDDATARDVLQRFAGGTWAVVGCSSDPGRASHGVARFLQRIGCTVVPVNPNEREVLGLTCYPTLRDVPVPVDVVDLFRRSAYVGPHVDEAVEIGAGAVWMQLGVVDDAAAERARAAGLTVVVNRCPAQDWPRLVGAA